MADHIFGTPTPVTGNDFDGQSHAWGMKFTVSADCSLTGGRAWIPAAGRPTTFLWQVWRVGDATKIAESNLNAAGHGTPTSGAWYDFASSLFSTPGDVTLSSAQTYRVCVAFQGGDGVYTDNGSETFPTGTGLVSASTGSFSNGAGTNTMPSSDYDAWFFADVSVATAGTTHEATGTAAATGATSATATVTREAAGTAAATGASSATATVTREGSGTAAATGASSATSTVDREASGTAPATGASSATATVDRAGTATAAATGTSSATATVSRTATGAAAATATATATATVDPGGVPPSPTVWRAGKPEAKWHAGQPKAKWDVGRMPVDVVRASSTETIRSGPVTATSAGSAVDPTGFTVTVAFAATDTAPAAGSSAWKSATWDTDTGTTPATYKAQAAIGPSGVQELAAGTWFMFVKITASGETPIIPCGPFKVVA